MQLRTRTHVHEHSRACVFTYDLCLRACLRAKQVHAETLTGYVIGSCCARWGARAKPFLFNPASHCAR
eukprot:241705-Alexandrium_andersonii.AAC.1